MRADSRQVASSGRRSAARARDPVAQTHDSAACTAGQRRTPSGRLPALWYPVAVSAQRAEEISAYRTHMQTRLKAEANAFMNKCERQAVDRTAAHTLGGSQGVGAPPPVLLASSSCHIVSSPLLSSPLLSYPLLSAPLPSLLALFFPPLLPPPLPSSHLLHEVLQPLLREVGVVCQ